MKIKIEGTGIVINHPGDGIKIETYDQFPDCEEPARILILDDNWHELCILKAEIIQRIGTDGKPQPKIWFLVESVEHKPHNEHPILTP